MSYSIITKVNIKEIYKSQVIQQIMHVRRIQLINCSVTHILSMLIYTTHNAIPLV